MANLKSFYFPGEVVEIKEIRELDNGKSVLNIIAACTVEVVEGFKETVEKTMVLFARKADEADEKINEGDCVIFSRCKRNPRVFTTEAGNTIESVDIIAEQFQVMSKSVFAKVSNGLISAGKVPDMSELDFTDEDLAAITKKAESLADI